MTRKEKREQREARLLEVHTKKVNGGAVIIVPTEKAIKSASDPTVGVRMLITPPLATEWLETRGSNRTVRQSVVDKYALDMKEGRWVFNGAPIQFDEEGKLLNGQHRLWAVIESGHSYESIVQWNIPRDSQATIDAGERWQAKDVLYMQGERNTTLLQSALKWILREESGAIMSTRAMTTTQAFAALERHPNIRHSVDFIANTRGPLKPSVAAYLHYRVSGLDPEKANTFFERLSDGANLPQTSPVYRLRERLMWRGERITQIEELALAIITWNAFMAGRELKLLTWRKAGPTAMTFPLIDGVTPFTSKISKAKPRGGRTSRVDPGDPRRDTARHAPVPTDMGGVRREVGGGGIGHHVGR